MLTLLFAATTVICAVGWLATKVSVLIMVWYLDEKKVPQPSKKDLSNGANFVVKHILKDLVH